jgi:hypothetical protein
MHRATKLDKDTIACDLEDATSVSEDERLHYLFASSLQRRHSASLVRLHEPTVADYVGCEDCGETVLGAFFSHKRDCF